jgi:hypothetical protein
LLFLFGGGVEGWEIVVTNRQEKLEIHF